MILPPRNLSAGSGRNTREPVRCPPGRCLREPAEQVPEPSRVIGVPVGEYEAIVAGQADFPLPCILQECARGARAIQDLFSLRPDICRESVLSDVHPAEERGIIGEDGDLQFLPDRSPVSWRME